MLFVVRTLIREGSSKCSPNLRGRVYVLFWKRYVHAKVDYACYFGYHLYVIYIVGSCSLLRNKFTLGLRPPNNELIVMKTPFKEKLIWDTQ